LPATSVAVIVLVTDEPRTTVVAPLDARLKSSDPPLLDTVTATEEDVVLLFELSLATAVRVCDPLEVVVVFHVTE
jgi:hypothetical protein